MAKPEIFISHSAKDNLASYILEALNRELTGDFDILLDKERLIPGVNWRLELFSWLKRCQGSVILLSEDALNSSWVLQESTILNWRRSYEEEFIIIPILIPPISANNLNTGWFSAIELSKIQSITDNVKDVIVEKVVTALREKKSILSDFKDKTDKLKNNQEKIELTEMPDQVAAICYKREGELIKFKLINTRNSKGKERWIFPKGWMHPGEPLWLSAILEARKEAGVAGEVEKNCLTSFSFLKEENEPVIIAAFLLEVESEFAARQEDRNPRWFTPEAAKLKLAVNRDKGRHQKNLTELLRVIDVACQRLGR